MSCGVLDGILRQEKGIGEAQTMRGELVIMHRSILAPLCLIVIAEAASWQRFCKSRTSVK